MEHIAKSVVIIFFLSAFAVTVFFLLKSILDLLKTIATRKKVFAFFSEHRTTHGEFIVSAMEEGVSYTTYEFQGKYSPLKPKLNTIPSKYYIRLKCQHGNIQYIATYQVYPAVYNKLQTSQTPGSIVKIQDSWLPMEYKII